MSARVVLATGARVLAQLRRDPRTIALVLVVPLVLLTLLKYVFQDEPGTFTRIAPPLLGLFRSSSCSWSPRSRCCASGPPGRSSA